eukprot:1719441-Amphidinium_carterae.1
MFNSSRLEAATSERNVSNHVVVMTFRHVHLLFIEYHTTLQQSVSKLHFPTEKTLDFRVSSVLNSCNYTSIRSHALSFTSVWVDGERLEGGACGLGGQSCSLAGLAGIAAIECEQSWE